MLNLNFKFLHLIIHFPGCLFHLETPNSFQQDLTQYSFNFGKTELWKDRALERPNFGHIELFKDKLCNFSTCERSNLGKTKAQQRGIHLSATWFGLGSLQLFNKLLLQVYLG